MKKIFSLERAKDLAGKRVLVRVDFNVPLKDGRVAPEGDTRLRRTCETIQYLTTRRAKVILLSHLGRPGGKVDERLRLKPVAYHLMQILGQPVVPLPETVGSKVGSVVERLHGGEVVILENLRFNPGEDKNDLKFARQLAALGDLYINEAFSVSHRRAASVVALPKLLPAFGGFQLLREVSELTRVRERPRRPLLVIMGGAKISSKFGLLKHYIKEADFVLVGGGIADVLLAAQGIEIGRSAVEREFIKSAKTLLKLGRVGEEQAKLFLPLDVVVRDKVGQVREVQLDQEKIKSTEEIGDIGLKTRRLFVEMLARAREVIWNGPVGIFEDERLASGTLGLIQALANLSREQTWSVVGGGETVEAVEELGVADKLGFVSSGGGAMLEFLEGKKLPGVEALRR